MSEKIKKRKYRKSIEDQWLIGALIATYDIFCDTTLKRKYDKLLEKSNKFDNISYYLFYGIAALFGIAIFLPLVLLILIPSSPLREWGILNDKSSSMQEINSLSLALLYGCIGGLTLLVGSFLSYGLSAFCIKGLEYLFTKKTYSIVSSLVKWENANCRFQLTLVKWKSEFLKFDFGFGESIYEFLTFVKSLWQKLTKSYPAPIIYKTAKNILNNFINSCSKEPNNCNKLIGAYYLQKHFLNHFIRYGTVDFKSESFEVEVFENN